MSRWWVMRLVWLVLGMLIGLIGLMPESANAFAGILALIYIVAWGVLLVRVGLSVVGREVRAAAEKRGSEAVLRAVPASTGMTLFWDSVLFLGATAACAGLFALAR